METIAAALIAAAGTILGSSIPVIYSWYKDRETLAPVSSVRQKAVAGRWQGPGTDVYVENATPPIDFILTATFELSVTRKIRGSAVLSAPGHSSVDVTLEGGFYNEDFLQLTYRGTDRRRRQLGVVVFELSDEAEKLTGHFAGFSPVRHTFVVGKLEMTRVLN
jgi:hypothetical protein